MHRLTGNALRWSVCSFIALSAMWGNRIHGAEQATNDPNSDPPIAYRRIFVPADNMAAWPRDNKKYIPVEAHDFDAWLAAANRSTTAGESAAVITQAFYSARLEDGQLINGRGEWTIAVRGNEPAFLPLGEMSLVVGEPRWRDDPSTLVRLGSWGPNGGAAVMLGVEVARSGVLEFLWREPVQTAADNVALPWRLPLAWTSRLVLDLPADKSPLWDGSVVLSSDQAPDQSSGWRRWVLAAGPAAQPVLRIVDTQAGSAVQLPSVTLREELSYHLGERGLEFESRWKLEGPLGERRRLAIAMPPGLQLVSATENGQELPWRLVAGGVNAAPRTLLELAERPAGRSTEVVLRGWQPLVTDKPWSLPKPRPDDVYWTAGTIQVSISPLIEARSLVPSSCLQTDVQLTDAQGTTPETCSFVAYSASANLEVVVGSRAEEASARVYTTLDVGNADVTGRSVTRITVTRGRLHTLIGELPAGWIVDAVETVPSDALGEWYVDDRNGRQRMELQLADATRPDRPVTVIISGRLQLRKLDESISAETLQLVQWTGMNVARNLLAVHAVEPYVVESQGGWMPAAAALTDDDRIFLPAENEAQIFDFAEATGESGVRLTEAQGQLAAEILLDTTLVGGESRHTYHLVCQPQVGSIDQLVVYASESLGDAVGWTDPLTAAPMTAERLPPDDPKWFGLPTGGELWQLRLSRPQSKSVEIEAAIVRPWSSRQSVPLVSLPEATEQRGRVLVRVAGNRPPHLEPRGLLPIPIPTKSTAGPESADSPSVWAAFRYEPGQLAAAARSPQLWLEPDDKGPPLGAIIARRLELESFLSASGEAAHRVTYQLENQGATSWQLQLPETARLTAIDVDGHPVNDVNDLTAAAENKLLTIPLSSARLVTVSLRLATTQFPLRHGSQLRPPLPTAAVPVLSSDWTIWLPSEYAALEMHPVDGDDWRQRLFGPLARPRDERPFDPFHRAAWAGLVSQIADEEPVGEAATIALPSEEEHNDTAMEINAGQASPENSILAKAASPPGSVSAGELAGWRAYRKTYVAGPPETIVLAHHPVSTAWAIALFLTCLIAGGRAYHRRRELFIVLTTVAAVLAIVLPIAHAPLASGAFLGLLCSFGFPRRREVETFDAPTRTWNRLSAVGAIATLMAILTAGWAMAEPATLESSHEARSPSVVRRVMIPTGADGRPVGTKLYLSEEFLRQLLARGGEQSMTGGQWLLHGARHRGELQQRPEGSELVAGEWTTLLDVEVLARDTTILLPLVQNQATWPATALVDGIPRPLKWHADGRSCAVQIAEPGRYEMAISFAPRVLGVGERSQIDLSLPPLLGAALELRYPANVIGLGVEGGSPRKNDDSDNAEEGVLHRELDDSGQLVVRWSRQEPASEALDQRVTELRWLRIAPSEVVLTVKYVASRDARLAQSLTISADRRWELLQKVDSPENFPTQVEGDRQIVQVMLPAEGEQRGEVTLSWRLVVQSLLGRLRLPRMELTGTSVSQCWLAVSNDPALSCEFVDANHLTTETADEFLTLWKASVEKARPQLVVANVAADKELTLAVRPQVNESLVDEVHFVAVGESSLRVQYQAEVIPGNTLRYLFPVTVPADLSIDQVVITCSGRPVPLRWTRQSPIRVNVFLGEEVNEPYRMVLDGHVPVRPGGEQPLPHITTAAKDLAVHRVHVYRDESVAVEMPGPANIDDAAPDLPPAGWAGRLVGAYQLESDRIDQVQIVVQPNVVETVGETLTALSRADDLWWATYTCRLEVQRGELDTLRLRVPTSWTGPFEVRPAAANVVVTAVPNKVHAILSIRLPATIPAEKSIVLEIHGPLTTAGDSPIVVPVIESEPRSRWRNYVSVPTNSDAQADAWTVDGVQPAAIPEVLKASRPNTISEKSFQVSARLFHVAIAPPPATAPTASVRLADTIVARGSAGNRLIATQFIVAPQGLAECELALPSGSSELVSVTVDGQPARIRQIDLGRWLVQFSSVQLPQMLDVIWSTTPNSLQARGSESIVLQRPTLFSNGTPIPVEMSLWSFTQRRIGRASRVEEARLVTAADQAALRLDRLISIAEAATPTAAGLPTQDEYYWFLPWAKRLADAQEAARTMLTNAGREATALQVSRPLDEQLDRATERIAAWIERCTKEFAESTVVPPKDAPQAAKPHFGLPPVAAGLDDWIHCVSAGGADEITVAWGDSGESPYQSPWASVLAIAGLAAAAVWLVRQPAAGDLFVRWPHAVGVIGGLAWWAWLWPSWLGLLVVAGSLLFKFRPGWPGQSLQTEGSTVLQPARPK